MQTSYTCSLEYEAKIRIDKYICENLSVCSRSKVKDCVTNLKLNGKSVKFSENVKNGDLIEFDFIKNEVQDIIPQKMDLDILYEDDNTIIINKAQGVVVHPACGNFSNTLVNGLMDYIETDDFEDAQRPGIVHRLDKDTSGVILVAKTQVALEYYSKQFHDREVKKEYRAIVKGRILKDCTIDKNIVRSSIDRKKFETTDSTQKGRSAYTELKVLERFLNYTYVAFFPKTGRTHQLRVHSKFLRTPILGDPIYSRKDGAFSETPLMLHAYKLTITLFNSLTETTFTAPIPETFLNTLDKIRELNF